MTEKRALYSPEERPVAPLMFIHTKMMSEATAKKNAV